MKKDEDEVKGAAIPSSKPPRKQESSATAQDVNEVCNIASTIHAQMGQITKDW